MPTQIHFSKTDGDSSTWPKCGRLQDGCRLDRLQHDDANVILFLERVAAKLAELLGYRGRWFLARTCFTSKRRTDGEDIKIDRLPEGYGLFSRSSTSGRQDRYLRGASVAHWQGIILRFL